MALDLSVLDAPSPDEAPPTPRPAGGGLDLSVLDEPETSPPSGTSQGTPGPDSGGKTPPIATGPIPKTKEETRNWLLSKPISDKELEGLAEKRGVDPEWLKSSASWLGASRPTSNWTDALIEGAKATTGAVGESIGLGLPQYLYGRLQVDPARRLAIEDLRELAEQRKSVATRAAEFAIGLGLPLGAAGKAGAGLATRAAVGAGIGATQGLTHSKEGEEVPDMVIGAALGLGGTAALEGAATVAGKAVGAIGSALTTRITGETAKAERAALPGVRDVLAGEGTAAGIKSIMEEAAPARERILAHAVTGERISDEDALQIVEAIPASRREALEGGEGTLGTLVSRMATSSGESTQRVVAQVQADREIQSFAQFLTRSERVPTPDRARTIVQDFAGREGKLLDTAWEAHGQVRAVQQLLRDEAIDSSQRAGDGWVRRTFLKMSDAKPAARSIDISSGDVTAVEPAVDEVATRYNHLTGAIAGVAQRRQALMEQLGATETTPEQLSSMLRGELNPHGEEHATVEAFRGYLEDLRQMAVDSGLPIQYRPGYVPERMLAPVQAVRAIEGRARSLSISPEEGPTAEQWASGEVQDWVRGVEQLSGETITREGDSDGVRQARLMKAWGAAGLPDQVSERLGTTATAAFRREGEIPDFLRENNIEALLHGWESGVLRHVYLREPLMRLRGEADKLNALGDSVGAGYVERLVQDISSGARPGTLARGSQQASAQWELSFGLAADRLREAGATTRADAVEALGAAPRVLQAALSQVYPNFLGLSPKATFRLITQPLVFTAPDIGARGYGHVISAYGDLLHDLSTPGTSIAGTLKEFGLAPEKFTGESRDWLRGALESSPGWHLAGEASRRWSDMAMFMYERTELMGRYITMKSAQRIVADAARGGPGGGVALDRYIATRGPAYQRAFESMRKEGRWADLSQLVAREMNAGTVMNYSRVSMSEFGRSVGPFLSTFTKWPTMVAGDVGTRFQQFGVPRGGAQVFTKYMAPWAGLALVDKLNPPEEYSPRTRSLVGARGAITHAPLSAVTEPIGQIIEGKAPRLFTPPLVEVGVNIARALKSTDQQKIWKAFQEAVDAFGPGSGGLRFLGQDLPALIRDVRPGEQGQGPIERGVQGVRELTK